MWPFKKDKKKTLEDLIKIVDQEIKKTGGFVIIGIKEKTPEKSGMNVGSAINGMCMAEVGIAIMRVLEAIQKQSGHTHHEKPIKSPIQAKDLGL